MKTVSECFTNHFSAHRKLRCRVLLDKDNFLARNIKLCLLPPKIPRQFHNEKTLQAERRGAEQLSHAPTVTAQKEGCNQKYEH